MVSLALIAGTEKVKNPVDVCGQIHFCAVYKTN